MKNIIRSTALETLKIESDTIQLLFPQINNVFIDCVEYIFKSKGRIIVTGIGKSAIVAQKITATLNSTGTPAMFMHAADAIHGDLGMIQSEDIILCLSKSGNTPEIKVLLPLVKRLGHRVIAMVSNMTSILAQQADYTIYIPIVKEADPNNLAPTASTTAQMAMGDALATALLAIKGFTPNDFAKVHPGGVLGKQLYLKVSDLYSINEKPKVYLDTKLNDVILEMTTKRLGMTVVLDDEEKLAGIITDGDLRRMLSKKQVLHEIIAKEIMTSNPKTIQANSLAINALIVLRENSITQLAVLDGDQRYVGVLHLHDLIREGIV